MKQDQEEPFPFESPIEIEFFKTLFEAREYDDDGRWPSVSVVPQFILGKFRFDFGILYRNVCVVLIECDGKEFHSTDEQKKNDVSKNRFANDRGIPVIRFTGSQIYGNPEYCVERTLFVLRKTIDFYSSVRHGKTYLGATA